MGQRLALTILTKLDPTAEPWLNPAHDLDPDLLQHYTRYKAVAAYLPGTSKKTTYYLSLKASHIVTIFKETQPIIRLPHSFIKAT